MSFPEPYKRFYDRTGIMPASPTDDVASRLAGAPFGDAARIHPVPVILSDSELDWMATATRQRARALQCLFADISCGTAAFSRHPGGMPGTLLDCVLTSHGLSRNELRRTWSGRSHGDVNFTYAPDLVPDGRGGWAVLEDNIGCIGGLADSDFCRRAYLDVIGLDRDPLPDESPDLCRGVAALIGDEDHQAVAVQLGCDGHVDGQPVRESARRATLLRQLGLHVGDPSGQERAAPVTRLVNFSPPSSRWYGAFRRGDLALLNAPHVEVLGDKRLLPYVDAMVAFFLDEQPMFTTLATSVVRAAADIAGRETGVVKSGRGAQGMDVYFLDDAEEKNLAMETIAGSEPMSFIVQELAPGAPFAGPDELARVELRPFAFVLGNRPVVASRTPSARVPRGDRRRGNLSRGSFYAAVLREPCGDNKVPEATRME